jgi:hypothetical protein
LQQLFVCCYEISFVHKLIGCDTMPVLKNPRRERMAQLLASGKNATEAHQFAGFKRDRGNASRLATDPEIQDRIQQITAVGAEHAAVTVESLIDEAEQARRCAMEANSSLWSSLRPAWFR